MDEMKKVAVAMLGARRHYAVPKIVNQAGALECFYTDSYLGNKQIVTQLLLHLSKHAKVDFVNQWLGRRCEGLEREKVSSFEWLGIWYALKRRQAKTPTELSRVFRAMAIKFNSRIVKQGFGFADIVIGFNGASLEMFKSAKQQGKICVLEQTMLPRTLDRILVKQAQANWPGWEADSTDWMSPLAMDGREEAEWELADAIVTGSDFVRSGLIEAGVTSDKIHVIPYGVDPRRFHAAAQRDGQQYNNRRPLRVLFAGEVGLRKGVPDLLASVDSIPHDQIQLRLVGGISLKREKIARYEDRVEFLGHLPRDRMAEMYLWADVFVFPSISEGSAGVIYEAIMSGCPVITTANSGSIIQDGIDGFIVPIQSPAEIAKALFRYIDDPELVELHRQALQQTRAKADIARYGRELVSFLKSL